MGAGLKYSQLVSLTKELSALPLDLVEGIDPRGWLSTGNGGLRFLGVLLLISVSVSALDWEWARGNGDGYRRLPNYQRKSMKLWVRIQLSLGWERVGKYILGKQSIDVECPG